MAIGKLLIRWSTLKQN